MGKTYDIDRILDEVVTLPSLPGTVAHIMRLVDDPNAPLSLVAKAISADPPLAIKTLRLVNTAYYGLRQKVTTIEHAVVLLGTKVIRNLAFTATVLDIMKDEMDSFFHHSVACGVAMRTIAMTGPGGLPIESPEEAFVYGLLHDIGKSLFKKYLPEEAEEVRRLVAAEGIATYEAENRIIGLDHSQLGASIGLKWKLPEILVGAIRGHHDVSRCLSPEEARLAASTAVADFICTQCGIGSDGGPVRVSQDAWDASGLSSSHIPRIMDAFFGELPAIGELVSASE
jgi:putative nucleotidyltransferase with HDIG domain